MSHDFSYRPPIKCEPIRWEILEQFHPAYGMVNGGVMVELRRNREGESTYAVVLRSNWELSKSNRSWDYAPIPSERTEAYLADHRWSKLDDAIAAAQEAAESILETET